jgi:hypothetical protein
MPSPRNSKDSKTSQLHIFTKLLDFACRASDIERVHCKSRAGDNPIKMSGVDLCIPRNERSIRSKRKIVDGWLLLIPFACSHHKKFFKSLLFVYFYLKKNMLILTFKTPKKHA